MVGRDYTERVLGELINPMVQVALARAGGFQAAVVQLVRMHLSRHAGNTYDTSVELHEQSIRLAIRYGQPDPIAAYLQTYGLDPTQCFLRSFHFILGAADAFASRIVDGYDPRALRFELHEQDGWIAFPISQGHHFAFDTLSRMLLGYLREIEAGRRSVAQETDLESSLIARSRLMQETWERIRRASLSDEIVLLRGESGTGKSFFARRIHELSRRHDGPFIEVGLTSDIGADNLVQSNLFGHERGAFTGATEQKMGLFSLADGGTIFLDEIGEATPELQAKLLRVMESQTFKRLGGVRDLHVNVRIITATNHDLERLVQDGRFRQDLYYRINVIPIELPALRHRPQDVPVLAQYLLSRIESRADVVEHKRVPPALAARLAEYDWPGNIRELDHALKYAVAMSDGEQLTTEDFPAPVRRHLIKLPAPSTTPDDAHPIGATVIDREALRLAIRETAPTSAAARDRPYELPAHIAYAKRIYLATLIEELHGDLGLISLFWDRRSEKTLRQQVRDFELGDRLARARHGG
jgi:DNA-binding NtrC family response regulator